MAKFTEWDVLECACLHKQVVEWAQCPHSPGHTDLADAVIHALQTTDPVTIRAVRSACAGRRILSSVSPYAYHGARPGPSR